MDGRYLGFIMRRVTIRDVAQRAGVSHQTVSRVLNNSTSVAAETRQQVELAIAELDYMPNAQAVGLSRNRVNIVGMVVDRAGDPFFGPIVNGACQALMERGRSMLLAHTDHLAQPSAIERLLRSRRIDGLILTIPLSASLEQARQLARRKLPLVLVDLQYEVDADYLAVDSVVGAYAATEHLLQLGHRRIGMITNRMDLPVGRMRLEGYQAALAMASVSFCPELVIEGPWGVANGEQRAMTLLSMPQPPTAIFAGDDQMAIGAMRAIARAGLRIPQDISLVGFNDIEYAQYLAPALTTVRQPLFEMGYRAGLHVCRMIDDGDQAPSMRVTLQPELIVRESTGRVPQHLA